MPLDLVWPELATVAWVATVALLLRLTTRPRRTPRDGSAGHRRP